MKFKQTLFLILAALFLLFSSCMLQAQPFTDLDSALENIENRMENISEHVTRARKCLPDLREALDDADFRAQGPLFRKMHVLLDAVEADAFAVSTATGNLTQFDARLETSELQENCIFLTTNEDAASLALMDLATATHEGDTGLIQEAYENLQAGLRSLKMLVVNGTQEVRDLQRSF